MADLSNLIYTTVTSNPPQPEGVAEPRAQRSRLPGAAGATAGLAPLVAILALSLAPLSMIAVNSQDPATHAPLPTLAYGTAWPHRPTAGSSISASSSGAIPIVIAK
jgi:hypothetical protein